jgi:hypothetical protein
MKVKGFLLRLLGLLGILLNFLLSGLAEDQPNERLFQQPKVTVEKVLKAASDQTSGRLPVLDGFVLPGAHPLDGYQKGFYQCTTQVTSDPSGGTRVKVTAKITAWYSDSASGQSGYQVLRSNGRLESDFLDRIQDALGTAQSSPSSPPSAAPATRSPSQANSHPGGTAKSATAAPSISAPTPGGSKLADAIAASRTPVSTSSNLPSAPSPSGDVDSIRTQKAVSDRKTEELKKEATNLEEILREQAKPNNLVAVKKSGTPVLSSPNEGAQQLFLADAEDEFEILDMNASWVHVRISGLSRGWIRRSSLELPEDTTAAAEPAAVDKTEAETHAINGPPFEMEREETATFPGDWDELKGKTVKIITLQKVNARGSSAQAKLDFIKSVLGGKDTDSGKDSASQGVVIIFDSEDGGMMATTLAVLRQWRAGTLSDSALWHHSYFDPPEAFQPSANP